MQDATPAIPSPHADGMGKAYWEGTSRGELILQRCTSCGRIRHYPSVLCPACHEDGVSHVAAAGTGRVHSWTVAHHAFHPAFADRVPYALVTVDLDEGVRALGLLDGIEAGDLSLGLAVKATFSAREDGFGDLTFRPA